MRDEFAQLETTDLSRAGSTEESRDSAYLQCQDEQKEIRNEVSKDYGGAGEIPSRTQLAPVSSQKYLALGPDLSIAKDIVGSNVQR